MNACCVSIAENEVGVELFELLVFANFHFYFAADDIAFPVKVNNERVALLPFMCFDFALGNLSFYLPHSQSLDHGDLLYGGYNIPQLGAEILCTALD